MYHRTFKILWWTAAKGLTQSAVSPYAWSPLIQSACGYKSKATIRTPCTVYLGDGPTSHPVTNSPRNSPWGRRPSDPKATVSRARGYDGGMHGA